MSRRRDARGPLTPAWTRVTLKCRGPVSKPHSVQRVATVEVRPGVDESDVPWRVRVDYGGLPEPESATGAARLTGLSPHLTRRFICRHRRCEFDVPVTDEKLGPIVVAHNAPVLLLTELSAIVSK